MRALLVRTVHGLGARDLRVGQLPHQLIPQLRELEIFLIRGTLRLLQRVDRRRETPVGLVQLVGERRVPRVRLVARLFKVGLERAVPLLEFRVRLRVRGIFGLRGLPRLDQHALRRCQPLLEFLRGDAQRPLLLGSPARGIRHRLVKIRDATLDLRPLVHERRPLLVRRTRGDGE